MTIPPAVRSRDQILRECGPETGPAMRKDTNTLVSQGKPDRPGRGQGRIALRSATGHSRNHRHTGSGRHRCIEPVGKAHILIAYIDIHEAAQISGVVNDSASQARIRRVQAGENLAQSARIRGHLGRTSSESAQDGRDSDGDAHPWPAFLCYPARAHGLGYLARAHDLGAGHPAAEDSQASNASSVGRIAAPAGAATASRVFRPSPELMMTVSAPGSSTPSASSRRSTPRVTPDAVSPKIPSVAASSRMASTTSASLTSATLPPVRRTTSSTYGPSAGLPMASDLAIVDGRTGCTTSWPARNAAATGAHPVACAPNTRYGVSATSPSEISSRNALSILTSCAPDATGTTIWAGSRQPSCSAISKPMVLDPSA